MKRSVVSLCLLVSLFSVLAGCGEREPAVAERSPVAVLERHESVALATTAPIPTTPAVHVAPAPTTPAPRHAHASDALSVRRLVVATGIEDHEPTGASDVVDTDEERVYAFLDVANPGEDETLVVTFASDDGAHVVGHVEVSVPAHTARWRTWAFSRHLSPGAWHAEVRTTDGRLVDEHAFEVR
jgi:hypothetical protein